MNELTHFYTSFGLTAFSLFTGNALNLLCKNADYNISEATIDLCAKPE